MVWRHYIAEHAVVDVSARISTVGETFLIAWKLSHIHVHMVQHALILSLTTFAVRKEPKFSNSSLVKTGGAALPTLLEIHLNPSITGISDFVGRHLDTRRAVHFESDLVNAS